jgi:RNA polymerase sigma-70 factor, ECF subfamily
MLTDTELQVRRGIVELLPRLRRFALVLTSNPADADDLTQAGIERALQRTAQYNAAYKLESWMFGIMQNMWIDERRKLARRGPAASLDVVLNAEGEDGRKTVEDRDLVMRLRRAIDALPDEQRAAVGLVLINQCSYKEAAEALNLPIGTVMSRLSRARQQLIASLQSEGEADDPHR